MTFAPYAESNTSPGDAVLTAAADLAAAEDRGEYDDRDYDAFLNSVPTTMAGYRRKIDEVISTLAACEEGEEALTEIGAAHLRRHLETLLTGLSQPRLV